MTMKTALISFLAATLWGLFSSASGRVFDLAEFSSVLFATGLAAWIVDAYTHEPRALPLARPIRLRASLGIRHAAKQVGRLAA